MKKSILSVLLVICAVLLILPAVAFADGETVYARCGDYLDWTIDSFGTLTVSGTGEMYDFVPVEGDRERINTAPWGSIAQYVSRVVVSEGVTTVGRSAFQGFERLESVTIGRDVEVIGASAFENCSNLSTVQMGRNVSRIKEWAFGGCSSLTGMTLYEGLRTIDNFAFLGCESITGLTLPSTVNSIGIYAFSDCASLTSFSIPSGVPKVPEGCFAGCESLVIATLPDSVSEIDERAFYNCYKLSMTSIPASVRFIGDYAYYGCSELITAAVPSAVTNIGSWTFGHCASLQTISIGGNTEFIAPYAFYGCAGLENVHFGGTYAKWDSLALMDDNEALNNATLHTSDYGTIVGHSSCGDNVTWILDGNGNLMIKGSGNMYDYDSETVNDELITTAPWGEYYTKIKTVSISDGVTSIGRCAFDGCNAITTVTVADSVLSMGDYAFRSCSRLETAKLGNGITSIGYRAFFACDSLKTVTVPKAVTVLGEGAFCYCSSLTDVIIPNGVKTIEAWTFYNCASLKSVVIGSSVQSIGSSAFSGCKSLRTVSIPDNVTEIKDWAFGYCSDLRTVTIGTRVRSIAGYAFCGCSAITDVYFNGSMMQWSAINVGTYNDSILYAVLHTNMIDSPSVTLSNAASTGKITLKWAGINGARSYEVWRANSSTGSYSLATNTSKSSYTDNSATPGMTYYYKVKAISASPDLPDSVFSATVSGTCRCVAPVITGSNNSTTGKVVIKWDPVDGAAKYEVYRATSKTGTYSKLGSTVGLSYTNNSAVAGKTYYYKVKAISDTSTAGNSDFSNIISRACDCAKPTVTIKLSNGDPRLSWSAVEGADSYIVYRATSKTGTYSKMTSTTKLSYTNTSAVSGKTYYYKVVAVCSSNTSSTSAYSSVVSIKAK